MVAWQSNPNLGALIADMGPYLGTDWPAVMPDLTGVFPGDAGEIDYYVFDPASNNYLTTGYSLSGRWSDSYSYVSGGTVHVSSNTHGGTGGPPAGAHIYVVWYDTSYSTVPAAPSVTPEFLTRSDYSALGTFAPPVYHFGPWITPPPQSFTFLPGSANSGTYRYNAGTTVATCIAAPDTETHGASTWLWTRDASSAPINYSIGTFDLSLGATQYAQENHPGVTTGQQGFYNAQPTLPSGAVLVEHETVWDHTHYAEMLAAVIGDIQLELTIAETNPGPGFAPEDINLLVWTDPPTAVQNNDTTFGFVERTAGVPTQTDLDAAYATPVALVSMPTTTSSIPVSMTLPLSYFYYGMLPYRDDFSPSVRVAVAIAEGIQGIDPAPSSGLSGRELHGGGFSVTATYTPPRYRFKYLGPGDLTIPPLRQFHRDDGLAGGARSQVNPTSRQASQRQGIYGTYL